MEYINCDLYNDNVLEAQKKEEDCKSITPIYSDNIVYECVYKEGTGGNHICEKKKFYVKIIMAKMKIIVDHYQQVKQI